MTQPADEVTVAVVPDLNRFPAQMRAGVDRAMRETTQRISAHLREVERVASETGMEIAREFRAGAEMAGLALRELANTSDRQFDRIDRDASATSAGIATKMRAGALAAGAALLGIGAAAAAGLGLVAGFGLKSAAALEQTTIGFTSLLGSADEAKKFLLELQNFAAQTPFEFAGVADASRRILAFGQSVGIARDQVIPTITIIGDLASVLGVGQQEIDSVIRALGQMASKGKLSQEEMLQLSEALPGFNANAAVASALGLSVADSLKLITAGGVDARTGIDAILQGMANFKGASGAMKAQAQTLLGVFSTFKDTIAQQLTLAFQPVIPQIKDSLGDITPIIGDAVGQIAPALGGIIAGAMPVIAGMLTAITPILTEVIGLFSDIVNQPGMDTFFDTMGQAIADVIGALRPLAPVLAKVIGAMVEGLAPVIAALVPSLDELVPIIVQMLEAVLPMVPTILELVGALVMLLVPFSQLLNLLLVDTHLVDLLAGIVQVLAFFIGGAADAVGELARWLGSIDWGGVGDAIGGFFNDLFHKVGDFFSGITEGLKAIPRKAAAAFIAFRDAAVARFVALLDMARAFPGRMLAKLGNLAGLLVSAGKDMIAGLWNGIMSMGGWIAGKIKSFVTNNIVGTVTDALGISSPSKVMADQVGKQIPAGIGQGIEQGAVDLEAMLGDMTARMVTNTSHAVTTINMGGVHISGRVTEAEAAQTGAAVMGGALGTVRRRAVQTAVRMA